MNSSVTSASLNNAMGTTVLAIDSSSGGAALLNSTRLTTPVDTRTRVLSGMLQSDYGLLSELMARVVIVLPVPLTCHQHHFRTQHPCTKFG